MTKSERENLLNSASRMLFQFSSLLAATEPESPEHTEYMRICEELAHLKWGVLSSRYLNSSVPVEKDFGYRELLYRMPDSDFKQDGRLFVERYILPVNIDTLSQLKLSVAIKKELFIFIMAGQALFMILLYTATPSCQRIPPNFWTKKNI